MKNLKEIWLVLSKMILKNSDFILESKIAELNQNKSKNPDQPGTVWKLYFPLEINE